MTKKNSVAHQITKNSTKDEVLELAADCNCNKCQHGCKFGSGAFESEEKITALSKILSVSKSELKEKYLEEISKFGTTRYRPRLIKKTVDDKTMPYGACIFFDEKNANDPACKIHQAKPLECKIATGCKPHGEEASLWFVYNYFVNKDDKRSNDEWNTFKETNKDNKKLKDF